MMRAFYLVLIFFIGLSSAHAQRAVDFSAAPSSGDALIVAVQSDDSLDNLGAVIGADALADLRRAVAATDYEAKAGATASFISGAEPYGEIHLIGVTEDMRARDWEDFGGRAGLLAKESKAPRVSVMAPDAGAADTVSAAFGAIIGAYSFDRYHTDATPVTGSLVFVTDNAIAARASFNGERRHVANAVNWVRDMQSEPANILYPQEFVRRARGEFSGVANISINVLDVRAMERLGMGAILGVGKGSVRPPRMMIVRYSGGVSGAAPIVLAGKGITFDTGGISIKGNDGMWAMKADMTGAAAVMGATIGLARSRAPVNVVAIAALAENMPGGNAQRPGDVVTTMSGKTIEIMSTDAEGRLVLSDAVHYAQQEFNPSLLVDVATLTGSVGRALGDEYAGLFTRDDDIADRLRAAGDVAGEDLWRLPLHPNHVKQISSVIADVKNGSTGAPGASTGAAFIGAFVDEETPWAHLDIAGVDWREDPQPTVPKGASGFSVRLLDRLVRDSQ